MKKFGKLVILLVMIAMLSTACATATPAAPEAPAAATGPFKVAVVTPSAINDLAFSQSMYDALLVDSI